MDTEEAKEENNWSLAQAPWRDVSRAGEAQGGRSGGRAPDADGPHCVCLALRELSKIRRRIVPAIAPRL